MARCFTCQQVKGIRRHPASLLQPIPIPKWKWETITMEFITGLPRTRKQNDSIMVVVDKLSKEAHFISIKSTYKYVNIADIIMNEIFISLGIAKVVIIDRNAKFTSRFWMSLFKGMDTKLNFSTTYHPQIDGQIE